jgi:hypothetical protein
MFSFLGFIKYGVICYRNLQFTGNIVSCVTDCNVEGYLANGHNTIWKHRNWYFSFPFSWFSDGGSQARLSWIIDLHNTLKPSSYPKISRVYFITQIRLLGLLVLVLHKYYFVFLISRLRCIMIFKLRLRSLNIKLLFQIRNGDLMRNVMLFVTVDTWWIMLFQKLRVVRGILLL